MLLCVDDLVSTFNFSNRFWKLPGAYPDPFAGFEAVGADTTIPLPTGFYLATMTDLSSIVFLSWFITSTALLTHIAIVFYAREFIWDDLRLANAATKCSEFYRQSPSTCVKAMACGGLITFCRCGFVSIHRGHLLMTTLAVPQLYRTKGKRSQKLRVVLGPLTPILATNNFVRNYESVVPLIQFVMCLLAFAALRPDNTAVLDLCREGWFAGWFEPFLNLDSKTWRKLHGMLAACNAAFSFLSLLLNEAAFSRFFLCPPCER